MAQDQAESLGHIALACVPRIGIKAEIGVLKRTASDLAQVEHSDDALFDPVTNEQRLMVCHAILFDIL
jgi:hypothetical protein